MLNELLTGQRTIIDVRAPVEFERGHLAGAVNLPILDDDERAQVGTTYKQQGPEAARALGHQLVSGAVRAERVNAWRAAIDASDLGAILCCWRGGERSHIAQAWLADSGLPIDCVPGGYKALRQRALEAIDATPEKPVIILAGRTGSGKTTLLHQVAGAIDLEGLANHRGSAFGSLGPQPAPATFENALASEWLKHSRLAVVLEDESKLIGRIALPTPLFEHMASAPVVLVDVPLATRIRNIRREYVDEAIAVEGREAVSSRYLGAIDRIRKRLGGVDHQRLRTSIETAFRTTDPDAHEAWIGGLLERYYDPMYDYQLEGKRPRIIFEGDTAAVLAALNAPDTLLGTASET